MKLLRLNLQPRPDPWQTPTEFEVRIPIRHFRHNWPDYRRNSLWYVIKNGDLVVAFIKINGYAHILPFRAIIDGIIPMNALKWKNGPKWYDRIQTRQLANLDGSPVVDPEEIPFESGIALPSFAHR
jgi:hypothetical protein